MTDSSHFVGQEPDDVSEDYVADYAGNNNEGEPKDNFHEDDFGDMNLDGGANDFNEDNNLASPEKGGTKEEEVEEPKPKKKSKKVIQNAASVCLYETWLWSMSMDTDGSHYWRQVLNRICSVHSGKRIVVTPPDASAVCGEHLVYGRITQGE